MSDSNRLPQRLKPSSLAALLFTHMTQGLTTTLPYVIAVYMVRDFLAARDPDGLPPSEEHVGKLTGLLGAMFCAAQLVTSYPMGMLSDIVGRRMIIILGNISCVIGTIAFGLSSNYTQAIISRLGAGFFNAIIGAEKAMIGESMDSAEQAKTMGHISLMWGIGTMIGPTMGGILSNPCNPETGVLRRWSGTTLNFSSEILAGEGNNTVLLQPNGTDSSSTVYTYSTASSSHGLCSPDGLLFKKPYFLPCLAASFLSIVATLLTIFYLDETLPRKKWKINRGSSRGTGGVGGSTRYMPLDNTDGRIDNYNHIDNVDDNENQLDDIEIDIDGYNAAAPVRGTSEVQLVATTTIRKQQSTIGQIKREEKFQHLEEKWKNEERKRNGGLVAIEDSAETLVDNNDNINNQMEEEVIASSVSSSLPLPWHKQRNVLLCLAGYALIAFCYILLDELIPIYASARVVDGGLGFPASKLASPLAFGGFILVVWALFGFPWMHARLGVVKCTTLGLIQTAPMALMIPAATFSWAPATATMWLAMGFKALAGTNAFTGCVILVNAVAPKESLGAVNGVGQTLASAVRAAGPALGGLFWAWSLTLFKYLGFESSWGHQFLPFAFGAVVALATLGVYAKVQLPTETPHIVAESARAPPRSDSS